MKQALLLIYFALIFQMWVLGSCQLHQEEQRLESGNHGAALARQYCTGCHDFVSPETLTRTYWQSVLTRMSVHLGFRQGEPFYGQTQIARARLAAAHTFPDSQLISNEDWQSLVLYYLNNSPDSLEQGQRPTIDTRLKQFNVRKIPWLTPLNGLTFLKVKDKNQILAGFNYEGDSNKLHVIDLDGRSLKEFSLPSVLTDVVTTRERNYLVCMGPFDADDTPVGTVLTREGDLIQSVQKNHQILLSQKERPVHLTVTDLDENGEEDFLLSEFGKFMGGLRWYKKDKTGQWIKKVLYDGPGSLTTKIRDVNQDGKLDILALISQGNESIVLFVNKGQGEFTEKKLLTFPPYFGSVAFEIIDFDQDGQEDILYINGDSGDFGHPPKPYHGIRFFRQVNNWQFEEKWFYPQQGSYQVAVEDFDRDGDPDIACTGFFAAAAGMLQEGFLYLENPGEIKKAGDFKAYSFDDVLHSRFMVMDHGDLDGDGDIDLILGAYTSLMSVPEKVKTLYQWQTSGGAIYFLENTLY